MRKILVGLFLMVFVVTSGFAASYAKKGIFEFGGSASYTSTNISGNGNDLTVTSLRLLPEVFYFVADNIALGAGISIAQSTTKATGSANVTENSNSILLEPVYVFDGNKVYPFLGLILGVESADSNSTSMSLNEYGIQGGIKVLIGSNGLLNVGLAYRSVNGKIADVNINGNNLALGAGFSLFY